MSITLCNNNLATCSCSLPYNLPDIYHLAVLHITCCRLLSVQLLFSSSISTRDCDSAACPMAVTGNSEGKVPCGVCCGCSHSCRRLLALNNDHIQPRAALQLRICETTCLTGNNSLWSNSSALQSGVWIIIFRVWGVFLFLFLFSYFHCWSGCAGRCFVFCWKIAPCVCLISIWPRPSTQLHREQFAASGQMEHTHKAPKHTLTPASSLSSFIYFFIKAIILCNQLSSFLFWISDLQIVAVETF